MAHAKTQTLLSKPSLAFFSVQQWRALARAFTIALVLTFSLPTLAANQEVPDEYFRNELKKVLTQPNAFVDEFEAEVWLKEMSIRLAKRAPHIPEDERFAILQLTHREAARYKLDPQLVLALIEVESNFDQFAISSVGAQGLMQVMPFWKKEIGHEDDDLTDIETNLRYGCAILSLYIKKEKKDITKALARYNGSRGKMWYPMRVYKALRKRWKA
ncbi:lytic transglycosylase domain-containing protein [Pleionea sp. CnH1-48]|uniref:lytic transglycosylase domain-containing protein n=1 Tax=Pleionea sp. CnH1-48 TaxID=2954494 RepID=UPI0020974796|nr:lytic transglycosylase domain-containing protein [Pleionea sp. CnH1-48]MCO7224822.1 lytic transglycosylase domain-containing protein [Pleionea sp. CnH1-48]